MSRVKFCPQCDEVLGWDDTKCKGCGAAQPDERALEKIQSAKEKELASLRRSASKHAHQQEIASPPPSAGTSLTAKAGWTAFALMLCSAIVLGVSYSSGKPHPIVVMLGWLMAAGANLAALWAIIHSAAASAIRITRNES